MKRLLTVWLVALIAVGSAGVWFSGSTGAQNTTDPAEETNLLLTQVAEAHQDEGALLNQLVAARATEQAAAEATITALQTQVADLQSQLGTGGSSGQGANIVPVEMNEVARAGAWDFMVTAVDRRDTIEIEGSSAEPFTAQGTFLLVALEMVNAGTDAQKYDPSWFRVMDDRGRSWTFEFGSTDSLALAGIGARMYQEIPPGLPEDAVVVFDIPPDATGLVLTTGEDISFTSAPQPAPFAIWLDG